MRELDPKIAEAADFYDQHYDTMGLVLRPGLRMILGDRESQVCRFCGRSKPAVSFRHEAHAIPESLGNKSLFTNYECDSCNQFFGGGIEDNLGNWSKPLRTFARVRGKSGVPTLKRGEPEPGWRIEYNAPTGFHVKQYENDPIFVVDEEKKQVRFEFKRDAYTPVAVFKAFVKIGLTLMPAEELPYFSEGLAWIREPDHTKRLMEKCPVFWTFQPGPMPSDRIVVFLLRRKSSVTGFPYAFLVLAYGNEMFQVPLPSPKQDNAISGRKLTFPAFPMFGGPDPALYGEMRYASLDLSGQGVVRDEKAQIVIGFGQAELKDLRGED